ncbi:adenylate/guanylate cyclase domain-containing protein [Aureimonas endophytica]|uniref:Adenylate/guanylate cyclase domain-containing protein n=1 Tax=Aureimonas endophytica TaxID=2027858 RepID=A0A916ZCX9_9HYPH|nr:adenylate/guanylate cyclase domain-containing protein [Aureimonas endophytica]GGD88530.1 adenylate/guanylate cyclase domain-containing protein [Aureimonas endophytica]
MSAGPSKSRRDLWLRHLRLGSGLVVGAFVTMHIANLALGLVSLDAMEAARPWLSGPWRSPPGTVLLYGALLAHFGLTLAALFRRRTLKMAKGEAMQIVFGLALPLLLVPHVLSTRVAFALSGHEATYPHVVRSLWLADPSVALKQCLALLIAWGHFYLGLAFWARGRSRFDPSAGRFLYTCAVVLPILALAGFASAGREAEMLSVDPAATVKVRPPFWMDETIYTLIGLPVALVFGGRGARALWDRRRRVRIRYPGGRSIDVPQGSSVLEASRLAGIPHPSVCGGRGRCSTCRVRILSGEKNLPAPGAIEAATLARIGAPPHVRLACQLRPSHMVEVAPVLAVAEGRTHGQLPQSGSERDIAVLFCDIRGFTTLSEHSLPFDVVFFLNHYFEIVTAAVEAEGGHLDKFIGDGAMALFGLTADRATAARQAYRAALRIRDGIARYNADYAGELPAPLRLVLVAHFGPAIVGKMGAGRALNLTAIGDTINVASRLEQLAKDANAELVLSDDLVRIGGIDTSGGLTRQMLLRGRSEPMVLWFFRALPPLDAVSPAAAATAGTRA